MLEDSDVVAFRSSPSDKYCHSLIMVNGSTAHTYDLPPMATVTLEKIEQPGEWYAFGKAIQRRLFTVSVSFLLNPELGQVDIRSLTRAQTQTLDRSSLARKSASLKNLSSRSNTQNLPSGGSFMRSQTQALTSSRDLISKAADSDRARARF